jgi:hypothetical protein
MDVARKTAPEPGPIARFLSDDHARLDGLLQSAAGPPGEVDRAAYDEFRAGLLRHIGMEEKILLPAIQRLRGGEPLPMAAKLRLDHSALAVLLMPTPTPAIIAAIRAILADHNKLEEERGGLYDLCDRLTGQETDAILVRLRAAPDVSVMPHNDSIIVMETVRRTVARAGYNLSDYE